MLQFCNEKRKKSIKIQEKNFHENHDFCGFSDFERHFFDKICLNFRFLSSMSARSRRALANLEKRIQKFIDTAFFWPVEVGKILMRLLIVNLNKLVRIISRRNRLVSKIALGDHLVGWSSIRGSIFRRIGYDQGGILYFSRARAREGFGDISGILAVFGGGRAAADDFAIFEKGLFLRGSKRFRCHYMQEVVPCCAIFAKLQNSLIQPRTSQRKLSLFEM